MEGKTNKELLLQVISENKSIAEEQLTNNTKLSSLINFQRDSALKQDEFNKKQEVFNQKLKNILFTDSDTNRDGYISGQDKLIQRVAKLETSKEVFLGKKATLVFIFGIVGGIVYKIITIKWK